MVTLSMEAIGYINIFERLTSARVKDCFTEEGKLVFIVEEGEVGKAVGKKGETVKQMSLKFKKPIKIIEFKNDPTSFLSVLLYPIKPKEIVAEDDRLLIRTHDVREKGQIYGRERTNLKRIQQLFSKYFPYKIELE